MTSNTKNCQHCHSEFQKKPTQTPGIWATVKYCSPTCRRAARPQGPAKAPRTGRCVHCHEPTALTRKYCSAHCQYWAIAERMDAQVDSSNPDGCWFWTGPTTQGGYGIVGRTSTPNAVSVLAHRAAIERVMDMRIPEGMVAAHHCDTPGCCNPAHIFITSPKGNMRDASSKGRLMSGARTRSLSLGDACAIRVEYAGGGVTLQMLGDQFGVTNKTIHRIISGQTYRARWQHAEVPTATLVATEPETLWAGLEATANTVN